MSRDYLSENFLSYRQAKRRKEEMKVSGEDTRKAKPFKDFKADRGFHAGDVHRAAKETSAEDLKEHQKPEWGKK